MWSRYSAYALGLADYLRTTWAPETCPAELVVERGAGHPRWLGLTIVRHDGSGDRAEVTFIARFRVDGRPGQLHETSRFERRLGHWVYVEGDQHG